MWNKLLLLLLLLLPVWVHPVQGQPPYFRHYEVEQGLSNNAVICTMLDDKGFLWSGTKDGLNRFDGYTFKTFRYQQGDPGSIGNNFIHSLYQDPAGPIWVGTEEGLYRYSHATETFQALKNTPRSEIRSIATDRNGNLWFIGGLILYCYNKSTQHLKMFSPTEYFQVTALTFTAEGQLWVATPSGTIAAYNPVTADFSTYDVFQSSPPAASRWIENIRATGSGALLIGTANQGIKMFDLNRRTYKDLLLYNADKTAIFARDFIRVSKAVFWIGTESGIYVYNLATGQYTNLQKEYNNAYSLSDNAVYTFCRDREGGIWVGTYFGGLNYYPPQYTTFYKYFPRVGKNTISGNAVREICPDAYGNLWIGTEDGGLNKFNLATEKFTVFKPGHSSFSLSNSNIHGLLVTGDTLWVGTFEHGLDLLNVRTGRVFRHYAADEHGALKSNFIYCIEQLRSGKVVLGTASGLYQYDGPHSRFIPFTHFPAVFYTVIFEDSRGVLWLGTYRNGLYCYDPRTRQEHHFKSGSDRNSSLSNNHINCVFEDSQGRIWVATEGGLCRFDEEKQFFERYTTENGMPSNVMYAILEDGKQNLWITTSKGLVRFSLRTHRIRSYTKANGLLTDQFNYNSAYRSPNGRMYFGSVKGLIRFDPAAFRVNRYHPPVYITGFQIFNEEPPIGKRGSPLKQSIILTDQLMLSHNQSTFSIDFAALSYASPERTQYAYKLEGLDENWTYLSANRKAFYTKLAPGDYTFRVKAANSSGIWNKQERRLHIQVLPPFWKSPAAYAFYGIFLLVLLWWALRAYHRRMKSNARRRTELFEHEKEKEVYQAKIEFFTHVAHEIRTPLTLIKGPMEKVIEKVARVPELKHNLQIMERNTNRLLTLTGQLLDFRKTEVNSYQLNFVKADVPRLLQEIFQRFQPAAEQRGLQFTLELALQRFNAYMDVEAVNKILSNLMNNAVKYAQHEIDVRLCITDIHAKDFTIVIENDGPLIPAEAKEKIFELFYRGKNSGKIKGTGLGLPLARSLTALHNGTLLLDISAQGRNVFKLTLPVHQKFEFDPVMGK